MHQKVSSKRGVYKCCVFQPAFRCCTHLKADWNTFLTNLKFFVDFRCFLLIFFIQKQEIKKNSVLSYSLKLVDIQTLGYKWARYKLIQGFSVTCLFTGQYNTKGYLSWLQMLNSCWLDQLLVGCIEVLHAACRSE